jgi:predicted site-specific integrase-resolvase
MELYTLASAAERIGCTPNRLKVWIDKGYVPEMRIQMGKVRARVVDEESIEKIKRVLEATWRGRFDHSGSLPALLQQ